MLVDVYDRRKSRVFNTTSGIMTKICVWVLMGLKNGDILDPDSYIIAIKTSHA